MSMLNLFIYTETSLHAGTGSTVSVVDLPIQRERTTQFPMIQGSGVKGALRSQVTGDKPTKDTIFGIDPEDMKDKKNESFAGAVSVGDAQIVLFPVRSLEGVFAYVTCRAVLARLARSTAGITLPGTLEPGHAHGTKPSAIKVGGKVVLEEFSFTASEDPTTTQLAEWLANNALPRDTAYDYWRSKVKNSLVVLRDTDFRDFVVNSTEISTHVKIDPVTKTVAKGALWTSESLPSDCLLVSNIVTRASRGGHAATEDQINLWLQDSANVPARIQIGGDETTGNGFVALRWS